MTKQKEPVALAAVPEFRAHLEAQGELAYWKIALQEAKLNVANFSSLERQASRNLTCKLSIIAQDRSCSKTRPKVLQILTRLVKALTVVLAVTLTGASIYATTIYLSLPKHL